MRLIIHKVSKRVNLPYPTASAQALTVFAKLPASKITAFS